MTSFTSSILVKKIERSMRAAKYSCVVLHALWNLDATDPTQKTSLLACQVQIITSLKEGCNNLLVRLLKLEVSLFLLAFCELIPKYYNKKKEKKRVIYNFPNLQKDADSPLDYGLQTATTSKLASTSSYMKSASLPLFNNL